jgi:hypothetical protein
LNAVTVTRLVLRKWQMRELEWVSFSMS